MANVNYVAIVPQTFEERVAMYMKCKKADLARMMAENEKRLCPEACAELQDKNKDTGAIAWTSVSSI